MTSSPTARVCWAATVVESGGSLVFAPCHEGFRVSGHGSRVACSIHADSSALLCSALHGKQQTPQQLHAVSVSCPDCDRELAPLGVLRGLSTPPIIGIDSSDRSSRQSLSLRKLSLESEPIVEGFTAARYRCAHLPFMCEVLSIAARLSCCCTWHMHLLHVGDRVCCSAS